MELELIRKYFSEGTNGEVLYMDRLVTYTIELPWKNNLARVSCIPEGRYELIKRWSLKFNWHLQIMNVSQRSFILIHPANDASRELKGCIAPVCLITGAGKGIHSRSALKTLMGLVAGALDRHEQIFITIKKDHYEFD
jgi:Family of unknown function (DUF5675)